ncbi:MAG TPA: DinB family protein, partial [Hanamia sp.]|nr:DinB family protein [Hanamia sp.]
FARKDNNTLPSFDENDYAANSNAENRAWKELIEEFMALRKSNELLFNSFTKENLNSIGKVSNYTITVLALGYVIVGHVAHHMNIIRERYIAI